MKRRYYTNEEKANMIDLYKSGLSQSQVAKIIGCSKSCVEKVLHANNVAPRDKAFYAKQFNDDIEKQIISDYFDEGLSIRGLAKKYGCSTEPIITLFKRNNLDFNEPSSYKKYLIDEHYFDEIDTQEKAYILGFLYADGANTSTKGHYVISLTLHPKDEAILERIKSEVKSNAPISDYINKNNDAKYRRFNICNKHVVEMLNKHGVVPNKSLIIKYPTWLRSDLHRHFMRGLFDGDGSISSDLNYIALCGSVFIMESIKQMLENLFDAHIKRYNYSNSHPNFEQIFCATRSDMARILHWMYEDSSIKLERKYQLYLKIKEKYGKYIDNYYYNGLATL